GRALAAVRTSGSPSGSCVLTVRSNTEPRATVTGEMASITGRRLRLMTSMGTVTEEDRGVPVPSPSSVAVEVAAYEPAWVKPGVQLNKAVSTSKEAPSGRPLTA